MCDCGCCCCWWLVHSPRSELNSTMQCNLPPHTTQPDSSIVDQHCTDVQHLTCRLPCCMYALLCLIASTPSISSFIFSPAHCPDPIPAQLHPSIHLGFWRCIHPLTCCTDRTHLTSFPTSIHISSCPSFDLPVFSLPCCAVRVRSLPLCCPVRVLPLPPCSPFVT